MPGVSTELQLEKPTSVSQPGGPQLTTPVADAVLQEMRSWYAERGDDENVSRTWKQLHAVLFKKVRVPNPADIWHNESDTEDGVPMVVSKEFVALQVKQVIERREQWLQDNGLPMHTLMNDEQKDAFLEELKAEYHGSEDQKKRQEEDRKAGRRSQTGKHQRWSRECQRRGGTTQMFHVLSFTGRWDPSYGMAAGILDTERVDDLDADFQ